MMDNEVGACIGEYCSEYMVELMEENPSEEGRMCADTYCGQVISDMERCEDFFECNSNI